ncbi:hypothetical protein AB0395_12605 [Streptosporangium sp. NPDC051023]|uniref:hypothetical protein n=1 Tax=Streptosporangium sp. NPDC051023 TaxID=3155410 RepID=UPI00344EA618
MIAGSRGRALSRRRRTAPWIVLLVCLGLCLGWQSGDLGLAAERQCVERVAGDSHPVDETPAVPLSHDTVCRRDPRARAGVPVPPCADVADAPEEGRAGRKWADEVFPVAPPAGARRLILLGVSRI